MADARPTPSRKQRARPSCDICRRQKVRCDSASQLDGRCTNCKNFNSECTHTMSDSTYQRGKRRMRKNKPEQSGTSSQLSTKNIVDALLRQAYPTPQDPNSLVQLLLEICRYARSLEQKPGSNSSMSATPSDVEPSGLVVDLDKLPEHLKSITMESSDRRFYGKNSMVAYVRAAMEAGLQGLTSTTKPRDPPLTRPKYWTPLPWEVQKPQVLKLIFPPPDLLHHLIDLYFAQINIFIFVLHRPTFEKSLSDSLHLSNPDFGCIVLAVCALASKISDDSRVFLPCEQGELSAGWEWFRQIQRPFDGPVKPASLFQLQLCCLYITFMQSGADLESCWMLSGIGLLQAQDMGALRPLPPDQKPSVEKELIKRCCHYLSLFYSIASACFGRPRPALPPGNNLQLAIPFEDDDYPEGFSPADVGENGKAGRPALCDFFNTYITLYRIVTFSWQTTGPPQDYTQPLAPEFLAELDSRLNEWANTIPEHLLWNPYNENEVFFSQSAALYASYYHWRIVIHRPFMQAPGTSNLRSLAICTNAARSAATVGSVKSRRPMAPNYYMLKSVFDAAIVLLLNMFGATRSGLPIEVDRELVDVYKCMALLRHTEPRHQIAGRLNDCLCELLNISKLPLPPDMPSRDKPAAQIPNLASGCDTHLPMAVDDLGNLPIYETISLYDPPVLEALTQVSEQPSVASLEQYVFTQADGIMETDHYLQHWLPYFSSVDGFTQAMHRAGSFSEGK
ncbi:fungal-trans domain-containing protein [Favolaschia claudopus]|uniref:Fungal-trans domain-containing protein n=1 Tax=Favolaschia claudopus TaxID=2862362 RepID=A0AAW0DHW1_9AGAR